MSCPRWLLALLITTSVATSAQASVQILGNTTKLRGGVSGPLYQPGGCSALFLDERPRPIGTFTSHNEVHNYCVPLEGNDGPVSVFAKDDFTTTIDASVIEVEHRARYSIDGRFATAGGYAFTDHRLAVSFQVTSPIVAEMSGTNYAGGVGRTSARITNANTEEVVLTNHEPGLGGPLPRTTLLPEGLYDFVFVGSWNYYDLGGGNGEVYGYGTAEPVRLRFLQPEPIPEPPTIVVWSLLAASAFMFNKRFDVRTNSK